MSGRSAEALCLEVRRPLKRGRTLTHRKTFSLDSGSGRQSWGHFSLRVDELWPADASSSSSSSSDSGMTSTVAASNLQDVEPIRSTVNRGLAGASVHHSGRRPMTPSSSELEVEVEELDSPSGTLLAPSGSLLAPSGSLLAPSGSLLAPSGSLLAPAWSSMAPSGSSMAHSGSSLAPSGSSMALVPSVGDRRISLRERNHVKNVRRRQRRRERWRQDSIQTCNLSSSSEDDDDTDEDEECSGREDGCICAVCLDVYFCPYMCHPCNHVFCEPCLRTLAKNCPSNTPCPLCRTTITHVFFQKELNHTTRTFFPKEYLSRKQNFQKASCAKWPLPSCRKLFRIFGGFQRQSSQLTRRQFPHGGYRLETLDFEEDSQGWRFDMDMVIIYIYSVNWVIGFFIFIILCYCFFPSL